jgi:predicted dehydrogenase
MSKPKTIGVIGLGSIGMRHAKNLLSLGYNVRAFDPDMRRRLMFNGVLWDMKEVLESDAIVIASPTPFHAHHIIDACAKPIFLEKPAADIELAGLPSNVLMVGYNLRLHSCVKKAKEWLDDGLIGEPLWANFTCGQYNDKPAYLRDGVILNWSHEIDLALYLLGNGRVAGSSTRLSDGFDDMTDILLTHEKGCRSTIHLDYVTKREQRNFSITGTDGKIVSDLYPMRATNLYNYSDPPDVFEHFQGEDSYDENYVEEMQAFLDRIDGKETIGATGAEGLADLDICLEVRKQAGLDPDAYKHVALGICRKCSKLHYSNEVCS